MKPLGTTWELHGQCLGTTWDNLENIIWNNNKCQRHQIHQTERQVNQLKRTKYTNQKAKCANAVLSRGSAVVAYQRWQIWGGCQQKLFELPRPGKMSAKRLLKGHINKVQYNAIIFSWKIQQERNIFGMKSIFRWPVVTSAVTADMRWVSSLTSNWFWSEFNGWDFWKRKFCTKMWELLWHGKKSVTS